MTAEDRASQFINDWRHLKYGGAYKLEQLVTQAILDAVEEAEKEQMEKVMAQYGQSFITAVLEEREACAKVADVCTKPMHCNVAATIRGRK